MTSAVKTRSRRSVAQLLNAYKAELAEYDVKTAIGRERRVSRIERLENRHKLIAIAYEALGDKTPEDAQAEIDAQLELLRLRRRAIRKVSKMA